MKIIYALKNKGIIRSTMMLIVISGVLKSLGYIEKILFAYYFGTKAEVDVLIVVSTIIFNVFIFFREIVEPAFLNIFLNIRNEGEEKEWSFFNSFLRVLLVPIAFIFIVGFCFPEKIIDIAAPGFSIAKKIMAVKLLKVASPAIFFLSISTIITVTLNSQKKFLLPAISDIAFKSVSILVFILFFNWYGIVGACIGIVFGSMAKLFIQLVPLWQKISFSQVKHNSSYYKKTWGLTWPLVLGVLFSQSNLLIDNIFASYMNNGTIAAISYAKKVVEMPVLIFPYVLSIVAFPYFAQFAIEKNLVKLRKLFYETTGIVAFVFLPLAILFCVFSNQLVSILFEHGAFDALSIRLTAQPLSIYSIGLPSFAIETIIILIFFSMGDTKMPIFIGMACVILNVTITFLLIPHMGYLAIALALVISKTTKVTALFYILKKKLQLNGKIMGQFFIKIILASALFLLSVYITKYALAAVPTISILHKNIQFAFCTISGIVIYLLACYALKLNNYLDKKLKPRLASETD